MELLDAAIALVITLAALATTVTVLMEIWIRFFGLKSQTQVELFQKIYDEAVKDTVLDEKDQWKFVETVLRNPLLGGEMRKPRDNDWIPCLGTRSLGVYEWVSHEHVYRRLLGLQDNLQATRAELVTGLERFTRKYDEFCMAATAQFKDNRRRWSIYGGILLALAINADGVRIFDEYMKRPELAAAMAARADELERTAQRAEERLNNVVANSGDGGIEEIGLRVEEMQASIAGLETAGVPLGWTYPPHCLLLDAPVSEGEMSGGNACRPDADRQGGMALWLGSIFAVLGTGILIGLGAPFWFDVARKLSQVRNFFSGSGGDEVVDNGDPSETPAESKTRSDATSALIGRVVDDALAENKGSGARRLLVEGGKV